MSKKDTALAKFTEGYNCSQSVIFAFCDDLHLDTDTALKLACGFGAGMGRKEEVCGAVSGGIMALGALYGRGSNQDRSFTETTYSKTALLIEKFRERHGSVTCRTLLGGCELTSPEGQRDFKEKNLFHTVCKECVGSVVEILETLMNEDSHPD